MRRSGGAEHLSTMNLQVLLLLALATAAQPVAPIPYPAPVSPPFDAATRPAPQRSGDTVAPQSPYAGWIAPHGDPRDSGWREDPPPLSAARPRMCGGISGLRCPEGTTCDYGPGRAHPDKAGVCRLVAPPVRRPGAKPRR